MVWKREFRPGFFGRRRDEKIAELNAKYGKGNWDLQWDFDGQMLGFNEACMFAYETAYLEWFMARPDEVDFVCSFGECIDNAMSNIQSGVDYTKQEAFSTHIQDIAVRNVLCNLDRWFEGPADRILVIRSADSEGYKYGPGNIPFHLPEMIHQPSKCPKWANIGSTEDFWQSNKYLVTKG